MKPMSMIIWQGLDPLRCKQDVSAALGGFTGRRTSLKSAALSGNVLMAELVDALP
jgi:hypothetical protein